MEKKPLTYFQESLAYKPFTRFKVSNLFFHADRVYKDITNTLSLKHSISKLLNIFFAVILI